MKDFFISYNSADRSWAEWIAWELETAGYSTVIQAWDFRPGSNFVLEMQRAAIECTRTLAVLSPNYLSAMFTQPEWAAAFAQDPTGMKGTLLPVRVRECDLRGLLSPIIYIDLFDADEATARQRLLDGVKHERAKPKTAPMFPRGAGDHTGSPLRFPGNLPSVWNVPRRNLNFTGRESELAQLHDALKANHAAALTALHGLGGIGKTQLAIEYAHRHASEYDIVWWMHAENTATLAADFARLAQPLDLREKDAQDQRIIIEAVKNDLRKHSESRPYLLIFDNATSAEDVSPFLPDGGHVIITSRSTAWRGIANPLSVQKLARADSIAFLLRRTGVASEAEQSPASGSVIASGAKQSPPGELGIASSQKPLLAMTRNAMTNDAGKLADALGDLPLALEQAGAYIEACGSSLADYLALFSARRLELLKEYKPIDYPDTVLTTWNLAFEQIASDTNATKLLNLCAFFAPDDIPLDLFIQMPGRDESLTHLYKDEYELNRALSTLLRFSLITKNQNGTISVHRLVQAVTRDRLTDIERKTFAESAVTIVNDAFPGDAILTDPGSWKICAQLLTHTAAIANYAIMLEVAPIKTARLFNQAALYLKGRAQFADAKQLYESALKIAEGNLGESHPNIATLANNLGMVLQDLSDLDGARQYFERAIKIGEAIHGIDHPKVSVYVNNLGTVLEQLGDLNGARQCYERALRISEAVYGSNHPDVAFKVNNLGSLLNRLGDLGGAREYFERALKIDEAAYGTNHPDVAIDVNNLGLVLKDLDDLNGAHENLVRALKIFSEFLPADHPNIKIARQNLEILEREMRRKRSQRTSAD